VSEESQPPPLTQPKFAVGTFAASVLVCAILMPWIDWTVFVAFDQLLRLVILGSVAAPNFVVPLFPWILEIAAGLACPAALFGVCLGWRRAVCGMVTFRFAIVAAAIIGALQLAVLMTIFPGSGVPDIPYRLDEAGKVVSFTVAGLAAWGLIRRWGWASPEHRT
jgi:hypothetical protein